MQKEQSGDFIRFTTDNPHLLNMLPPAVREQMNHINYVSRRTYDHLVLVAELSGMLGLSCNLNPGLCCLSGFLHDCGKLSVDVDGYKMNNPDILSTKQFSQIARHTRTGFNLLQSNSTLDDPYDLETVASIIVAHHEDEFLFQRLQYPRDGKSQNGHSAEERRHPNQLLWRYQFVVSLADKLAVTIRRRAYQDNKPRKDLAAILKVIDSAELYKVEKENLKNAVINCFRAAKGNNIPLGDNSNYLLLKRKGFRDPFKLLTSN